MKRPAILILAAGLLAAAASVPAAGQQISPAPNPQAHRTPAPTTMTLPTNQPATAAKSNPVPAENVPTPKPSSSTTQEPSDERTCASVLPSFLPEPSCILGICVLAGALILLLKRRRRIAEQETEEYVREQATTITPIEF